MKRFPAFLLTAAVAIVLTACKAAPESSGMPEETMNSQADQDYVHTLFDDSFVHEINVSISDADWQDLQANPVNKTKYKADIEIDGEVIRDVSFATKGNSTLFIVAADYDNSRYSYRVNFGRFTDGQKYHGLDKLSLNNCFSDTTYMKDYFCYDIFRKIGVPSPMTSFVWLTVNGEDRGLYMAAEDEDESFLGRINEGRGAIYKPESKGVELSLDMMADMKLNGPPPQPEAKGADLVYKDDDLASYPDIFENIETHADEKDHQAVIAALKSMANEEDLDLHLDTDEIIRYFAAHNFVLNYDSYTGTMLHNLILFENDGRLSVLPWDYNAAFGSFTAVVGEEAFKDATDLLNQGIDSPLIGTDEDSRPLWRWIIRNETYRRQYHDALDKLITEYFDSGEFERKFDQMSEMLLPYAEKEAPVFYTTDEYRRGCETLKQFAMKRAQSVRKQLSGDLSVISSDQADSDKVDASDLRLIDMGASIPKEKADSVK